MLIAAVGLLGWTLGIPFTLFMLLKFKSKDLMSSGTRKKYGFLYAGFQDDCYYYEAVFMMRRAAYLMAASAPVNHDLRTALLLTVTCFFFACHAKFEPFDERAYSGLDRLESSSQCFLVFLIFGRTVIMVNDTEGPVPQSLQVLCYTPAFLACWWFLGFAAYLAARSQVWPLHRDPWLIPARLRPFLNYQLSLDLPTDTGHEGQRFSQLCCASAEGRQRGSSSFLQRHLDTQYRTLFHNLLHDTVEIVINRHEHRLGCPPHAISLPMLTVQLERLFVTCIGNALKERLYDHFHHHPPRQDGATPLSRSMTPRSSTTQVPGIIANDMRDLAMDVLWKRRTITTKGVAMWDPGEFLQEQPHLLEQPASLEEMQISLMGLSTSLLAEDSYDSLHRLARSCERVLVARHGGDVALGQLFHPEAASEKIKAEHKKASNDSVEAPELAARAQCSDELVEESAGSELE